MGPKGSHVLGGPWKSHFHVVVFMLRVSLLTLKMISMHRYNSKPYLIWKPARSISFKYSVNWLKLLMLWMLIQVITAFLWRAMSSSSSSSSDDDQGLNSPRSLFRDRYRCRAGSCQGTGHMQACGHGHVHGMKNVELADRKKAKVLKPSNVSRQELLEAFNTECKKKGCLHLLIKAAVADEPHQHWRAEADERESVINI